MTSLHATTVPARQDKILLVFKDLAADIASRMGIGFIRKSFSMRWEATGARH
jgi:hypothetical protein